MRNVLTTLEITVAMATPATPRWNPITRRRFKITFSTPDTIR